ncbi:hypothetical protein EVAR_99574_1 [Eumeta japonica]|uniref:Uncharacterized protein n=1 Tax=Eumeta variegata TaxID=151549 RepID=A0A4C1SVT0_EUMVA|nr:hypothetical protein EVAR_99574_1 [Eumeta japonica]
MVGSPRPAAQIPQSKMNLWDERFSSGRPKVISDNPKRLDAARPPSMLAAAPESGLSENLHASTDYYWRPNKLSVWSMVSRSLWYSTRKYYKESCDRIGVCHGPLGRHANRRKPTSAEDQSCVHAPDRNATNRAPPRTSCLHSLRSPMHSHLKISMHIALTLGAKI